MRGVRDIVRSSLARILAGFALVGAVFGGAWLWSLSGPLTDAVVTQQQDALTAVAQSASLLINQSKQDPARIAKQLVARTNMRLTVVASDGTVLVDSDVDPTTMENHAGRPEIAAALRGRTGVDHRPSRTEGHEQLYVAVPGSVDGQRAAIRVAQPLDEINRLAGNSRRLGVLLLAFAAMLGVAIGVSTARSAARPVQALSQSAQQMAAGDLTVPIPPVPSDLEALADSLETLKRQMRAKLEAIDAERLTLRATLDGLSDAVFVLQDQVVVLANRQAGLMFRVPAVGWTGARLEASGLPVSVAAAVSKRSQTRDSTPIDLEPDPTGRTFRVLVAPLDPEECTGRSIAVISDITQRATLDRVRRDFVANASHELKTPVAGIGLLAQSAEFAAADGDDEQAVAFTRQIGAEVARLQRLVADLLDLSRLEGLPSEGALTDVRQAVDLALVSHRSTAARRELALDADLTAVAAENVFVAADPTDVAIALDNLLDNAIAYTDSGSVRVRVTASHSVVTITVTDTGPGIAAEHLSRIFERFYRVDSGRSREAGGTGLGLALVKHVAERNGGSVAVTSRMNEGSSFSVTFPRAS